VGETRDVNSVLNIPDEASASRVVLDVDVGSGEAASEGNGADKLTRVDWFWACSGFSSSSGLSWIRRVLRRKAVFRRTLISESKVHNRV